MIIRVDVGTIPPVLSLEAAEDMRAFSVRVNTPEHTFVAHHALVELAADRARDAAWCSGLERMMSYAGSKGWIREEDGAIQAHVEWRS